MTFDEQNTFALFSFFIFHFKLYASVIDFMHYVLRFEEQK